MLPKRKSLVLAGVGMIVVITLVVLSTRRLPDRDSTSVSLTNYGIQLPPDALVRNSFKRSYYSLFEASKNVDRYYKIGVSIESFDAIMDAVKIQHGSFVIYELPKESRAELEWWNKTTYDACYFKKIVPMESNTMLDLYLLKDGTNRWVMFEEIKVTSR